MNLDKSKIIKAVVVIAFICVGVGMLTQVSKQNSLTLQDYAEQYPETTAEKDDKEDKPDDIMDDIKNEAMESSVETSVDNSMESSMETSTIDTLESTSKNENAEDMDMSTPPIFTSVLTGAQLNGNAVMELRTTYTDYFYYEPLSEKLRNYITGVSYPLVSENEDTKSADTISVPINTISDEMDLQISYDDLRYLHIMHYNFDGELVEGEMICNKGIAQDLVEIFYELYRNEYRIEKVLLIEKYQGDDTVSMEDNNTSCFNYRSVPNSSSLSKHALGLAIDINPLYNPYITYNEDGSENVSPAAGSEYADRNISFPYKIDEKDLCYKLFTEHGFTWGGNWNSCKDYQHFQKVLP